MWREKVAREAKTEERRNGKNEREIEWRDRQ